MRLIKVVLYILICSGICAKTYAQCDIGQFELELIECELIFKEAPFKQCHASSLVELSDGRIMAVWFGGTYERHPDVCVWGSVKNEEGWSNPEILADGIVNDSLRYPCWNPVLFKNRKGEIFPFYKVGPSPSEWWGVFKKSDDNGNTWSIQKELPNDLIGPAKNKPIYLSSGRIVSPSSTERGSIWNCHVEISDDDGYSWSKIHLDTSTNYKLIQPALLTLANGNILALMRSDQNCLVESISKDQGVTWSEPKKTNVPNPNSGIDALSLSNGLHVLVNNPALSGNEWYTGRNKLNILVSSDGTTWYDVLNLEDQESGEYSYPAIIESSDGLIHITYTYDRKNIKFVSLKLKIS